MRLENIVLNNIKEAIYDSFGDVRIYLFGSRIEDNKKGGDIDILILDDKLEKKEIREIRIEFFKKFGEQKLDIVLDKLSPVEPFTKIILNKAI